MSGGSPGIRTDHAPIFTLANSRVTDALQRRLGHRVDGVRRAQAVDEVVRLLHLFVTIRAAVSPGRQEPVRDSSQGSKTFLVNFYQIFLKFQYRNPGLILV